MKKAGWSFRSHSCGGVKFFVSLSVNRLAGVGAVTVEKLARYGIYSCGDVQRFGLAKLNLHFGRLGWQMYRTASVRDNSDVFVDKARKSVSIEQTFSADVENASRLIQNLEILLEGLRVRHQRLGDNYAVSKRFIEMKFSDFSQTTIETVARPGGSFFSSQDFNTLMMGAWDRVRMPVRLLGVGFRLEDTHECPE
jgi:DNA polymerase-4